jgi:hypothetical protein
MWWHKLVAKLNWFLITRSYNADKTAKKIAIINCLNPQLFDNVFKSKGVYNSCLFKTESMYSSIDKWIRALNYFNNKIERKVAVETKDLPKHTTAVSIYYLFINSYEKQTNPVEKITEYKAAVIAFIENYALLEESSFGECEHNFRVMRAFEKRICLFTEDLIKYSHG